METKKSKVGCACCCNHSEEASHHDEGSEAKERIIKIGVAAVLLVAAMIVEKFCHLAMWQLLLVYLVPYLVVGYETLKEAAEGIAEGDVFNEDFLMSVATIGALSIAHLMDIRPDVAYVEREHTIVCVSPEEVGVGEVIVVKPGEKVPLDGIVVKGQSSLNTVALTGESMPREVKKDDDIASGCVNLSGVLRVKTTKAFGESTVSKIIQLVERAEEHKSKSESFIKRFARVCSSCFSPHSAFLLAFRLRTRLYNMAASCSHLFDRIMPVCIGHKCASNLLWRVGWSLSQGHFDKGKQLYGCVSKVRYSRV